MSRRVPVSLASRTIDRLCELNPSIHPAELPADLSLAGAVRGHYLDEANDATGLTALVHAAGLNAKATSVVGDAINRDARILTPQDLCVMARWERCRQVYDFNDDLARELMSTGGGDVPSTVIRRLPYPIVYVRAKVLAWDGFWACADKDWLMVTMLAKDGHRRQAAVPISDDRTVDKMVASYLSVDDVSGYDGVEEKRIEYAERYKQMMSAVLSLVLYIVSDDPDMEVTYAPPSGARGQRQGRRTNPETVHSVGARVGRELGAVRREMPAGRGARDATDGRRSMPPHVRAAHWQHYWIGPRKGRTDGRHGDGLVVHWIPPIAINGGGGDEVVHPVRGRP